MFLFHLLLWPTVLLDIIIWVSICVHSWSPSGFYYLYWKIVCYFNGLALNVTCSICLIAFKTHFNVHIWCVTYNMPWGISFLFWRFGVLSASWSRMTSSSSSQGNFLLLLHKLSFQVCFNISVSLIDLSISQIIS